ncbi:hypothetical protein MFLAVUS_010630, partial [Mucor flavus]
MSPYTKNTLSSREPSPRAVKAVPKVAISNVSKPTSANAKKYVSSKLGELGLRSMSSTASNEAGSSDIIEIEDSIEMNHDTYDSMLPSQFPLASSSPFTLDCSLPTLTSTLEPLPSTFESTQSSFDPFPSSFDSSLNIAIPEWALQFQKQFRAHELRFEQQDHRFHQLESLINENSELKKTVASQASLIAELNARLLAVSDVEGAEEPMALDTPRDLSTNGSKWSTVPITKPATVNPQTSKSKPNKVVHVKPTFAQMAASKVPQPAPKKKKKPVKKPLTDAQFSTIGRPFSTVTEGPNGFKYVYIGRSRKITRADTRSRFKQVGIDNSRILDINFPAHGVIGVLVHLQYVDTFEKVILKIGGQLVKNFDPLDPVNLANPEYNSYSLEARADITMSLQHNRCMNALLYLRNTRPYQVKPVGYSLVELGFISEEDVLKCSSLTPQDPKARMSAAAGELFTSASSQDGMDTDIIDGVQNDDESDGGMSEVEEYSTA